MTTVTYVWKNNNEQKTVKTLTEAKALVEEYGGSYEVVLDERLSQAETGYCRRGAAYASDRWKNYKY